MKTRKHELPFKVLRDQSNRIAELEAEVARLKEIDRASFRAWEKSEAEVARLTRERQALLVLWQDGPSLPDCHACAVVGAALRGEGGQ